MTETGQVTPPKEPTKSENEITGPWQRLDPLIEEARQEGNPFLTKFCIKAQERIKARSINSGCALGIVTTAAIFFGADLIMENFNTENLLFTGKPCLALPMLFASIYIGSSVGSSFGNFVALQETEEFLKDYLSK